MKRPGDNHEPSGRGAPPQRTTGIFAQGVSRLLILLLLLTGGLAGCGEATALPTPTALPPATATPRPAPGTAEPAYWPTTGWRTTTPEEQGVDSAQLLRVLQHIGEEDINVRTLTVIRNGTIVLEAANQPYTRDMLYEVKSVTKSVIGALVGIAVQEGYIKDINQPVLSFFPERTIANRTKDKEALTIRDLLTMQPGLDCADDRIGPVLPQDVDWVQYTLDLPMASPPGQTLVYCTAGPHLLSAILTRATGMSTLDYAQSRLFTPLGIRPGDFTWGTDPQGITLGGYGIALKPRDMAKLGLLYLYGGQWAGRQIVPEAWVAASTRPQALGENHKDYGYLFWVYPTHFAAEGLGEQKIQVVKDRNLVVVTTAAIDWHKGAVLEPLLRDYIIPAAAADGPLPANPAALGALQAQINYLTNPVELVQPLSAVARRVSGTTYVLQDNPLGWQTLTFTFAAGNPNAQATLVGTDGTTPITQTVALGMDNCYRVDKAPDGSFVARRGRWADDHTLIVRQLQSSPDIEETELRAEFSGDGLKIHIAEIVFDSASYDVQGSAALPPPTATPVAAP